MDCSALNHRKNKLWLEVHGRPKQICLMIALLKIISWLHPLNSIFWFMSQNDLGAPEMHSFQKKQRQNCSSHRWVGPELCAGSHWSTLPPPQMQVACACPEIFPYLCITIDITLLCLLTERYPIPEGKLTLCWLNLQHCFRAYFIYILQ